MRVPVGLFGCLCAMSLLNSIVGHAQATHVRRNEGAISPSTSNLLDFSQLSVSPKNIVAIAQPSSRTVHLYDATWRKLGVLGTPG